ncbi:hypothetical protein BGW39_004690 [Mortierella sp. 14UC]|nr:hypothetical protein BGW39_004690 [Mortierella sp. 14UC]
MIDIPEVFIVVSPSFQERLEGLLQKTPPKTIHNYLAWTVIQELSGSLILKYHQPMRVLNAALSGVSADVVPDRWKTCVGMMNAQLGDMAGQYFISDAFKGNSRAQVRDMIESLRETYLNSFPNLNWLDKSTTEGAIKKMKAIVQLTGFSTNSPNVGSSTNVDAYYKDYKVDPKDHFGNQTRMNVWGTERYFNELDKPVNKRKMHMSPQTVNVYYSPTENQIVFPAGILQPLFFHTENPEYINWGGIGVVAGHGITHSFDNKGHQFDALGRLANDYNVNGQLTLGENIADNGGFKQSFDTWKSRFVSDPTAVGKRPESAIRQMRADPHSPAKWKINGAVQNSVGFAEAFKCKAKAPMSPDKVRFVVTPALDRREE